MITLTGKKTDSSILVPDVGRVHIKRGDSISAHLARHVPPHAREHYTLTTELGTLDGIGPARAWTLADAGITTLQQLVDADAAALDEATVLGIDRIQQYQDDALAHIDTQDHG